MTRTLATDASNDLVVTALGSVSVATGLAAVAADCRSAMQAQLGEMVFAQDRGMPTLATAWNQYIPAQFEAAGRRTLLRVPDVTGVDSFVVTREGERLRYTATLRTVYGEASIDASV